MNKLYKRIKETDSNKEYNILMQTVVCHGDGESYLPDWSIAVCNCPSHKKYWRMREHRGLKQYYNRQRSWKKFRKTQYKR